MSPDPIIIQTAIAIPVSIGLVVFTLARWDRTAFHLLIPVLLTGLILWLGGNVLKITAQAAWLREVGFDLEMGALVMMPGLFAIAMGYFARAQLFEDSHAPAIAVLAVTACFFVAYVTDGFHHLMVTDREAAVAGAHPTMWGGPIFWALQLWAGLCDIAGIAYCALVVVRGPTQAERLRGGLVLAAIFLPILAHVAHMTDALPIDYSLVPITIAATAFFFIQGVHRYGVLGGRTIVRHDLIEHLDAGLILTDEHGQVLDANRAAESLLGCRRDELSEWPLGEVLARLDPEPGSEDIAAEILALPLDGGSRVETEIQTRNQRLIELAGGGVPTIGTQPAGRFVTLQDRTAQRRSELMLRERQKMESVGVLAAGVAHEVNNPLAYVRANLSQIQSIADKLPKDLPEEAQTEVEELPELLTESIEGLDRIARIVESMLRFSRTSDEAYHPVDIADVVRESLRLAELQRGTSVRSEWNGVAVPPILGNAERLVQVLLNLFLNARQAMAHQEDGLIRVETDADGDQVLVRVIDNGPGIPAALRQKIFDPFFTTRGPDSGTGLGLSIAFDIVREHGGTIGVESEVGAGACFTIRLAVDTGEAEATS